MVSASKSVVAAVVVAWLGSFLLASSAMAQSEEAAGAATSASATPEDAAAPIATEGLLATVGTSEVRPGVWRVVEDLDDWEPRRVRQVAMAPDGSVWILGDAGIRQIGGREWLDVPREWHEGPHSVHDMRFVGDDTILVVGDSVTWYDGTSWQQPPGPVWRHVFAAHGDPEEVFWVSGGTFGGPLSGHQGNILGRLESGEWFWYRDTDLGIPGGDIFDFVETDDGTLWAVANSMGGIDGPGILRLDGDEWQTVMPAPFEGVAELRATDVAVAPDGDLWASVWVWDGTDGTTHLARWDGADWTAFDRPTDVPRGLEVGSDGAVWVGGNDWPGGASKLSLFDGETWVDLDHPEVVRDFTITADGYMWAAAADGRLYVIDPEATAGRTEVQDPS